MKKPNISIAFLRAVLSYGLVLAANVHMASAHSVWIEETRNHQLVVRFAEWPDAYEVSPGHLDELSIPDAWKLGATNQPVALKVKKKSDQFQLLGATSKDAVQVETGFDVMTATNGPSRKPYFYARWQPAGSGAARPSLNFDIVPTGNPGEYQVYFRGSPLGGTTVTAHTPDGKEKDLTADEHGIVHFTGTKPGLYLLTCAHQRENVKGYSDGVAYDVVSHNCAISWRQP